jgi:hypothetical protein
MMKKVDPKAKNVAMLYEDDEFSRSVRDGALQYMKSGGVKVIFDRTYPSKGHQMNLDLRFWIYKPCFTAMVNSPAPGLIPVCPTMMCVACA